MLYITQKWTDPDSAEIIQRKTPWHAGEKFFMEDFSSSIDTITEIQVDGDEKNLIESILPMIPHAKGRSVVRWFGDTAKFIVANLCL